MSRTRAGPWHSPTRSARWSARRRSKIPSPARGEGKQRLARSDVSADEGFDLADEGEILEGLVRELVAERAVVLGCGEIERDQVGLGGGRGLERFDDLAEPGLGVLGD